MSHCQRGLELLESATDREGLQQQELDLYMTLGTVLLAIKGWGAPEAGQAYERALTLCDRVGASDHLSAVRRRLLMFYMARGETRTALDQAMHLVRETDEHHPSQWLMAHTAVGVVLFYRGDLRRARIHLGQVLTTYHPDHHDVLALQYGHDPGVICHGFMALALGYMGALGQALNHIETSLELARQLRHPYSLTLALITAGIYALHLRDVERAAIYMEELFTLYTKQDEHYSAMHARIFQGWLETVREDVAAGILKMQESLEATAAMGGNCGSPFIARSWPRSITEWGVTTREWRVWTQRGRYWTSRGIVWMQRSCTECGGNVCWGCRPRSRHLPKRHFSKPWRSREPRRPNCWNFGRR